MNRFVLTMVYLSLLLLFHAGCQVPEDAMQISKTVQRDKRMQIRYFDTSDEIKVFTACADLLQDLNFTIHQTEAKVGLLVASKDHDADEPGGIIGVAHIIFLDPDEEEDIYVSIVTSPYGQAEDKIAARVIFEHIVTNEDGEVTDIGEVWYPKMYEDFFQKLSQSLSMKAHKI